MPWPLRAVDVIEEDIRIPRIIGGGETAFDFYVEHSSRVKIDARIHRLVMSFAQVRLCNTQRSS